MTKKEKIAEIIWWVKFDKGRPNLPFRNEEDEVNKIVEEIMKVLNTKK